MPQASTPNRATDARAAIHPGALSAVDTQDLGGDKSGAFEVQHRLNSGRHLLKLNLSAFVKIYLRLAPACAVPPWWARNPQTGTGADGRSSDRTVHLQP
jgi:hypothetical protein